MGVLPYKKPQLQKLEAKFLAAAGVQLWVRREDQNHPTTGGNKWWKLRDNVASAISTGSTTLVTFGGAWSNHIRATAAAAKIAGLESVGIIRGEQPEPLNPVLSFARGEGMKLKFVSRERYAQKTAPDFLQEVSKEFSNGFIIPEGGSNELGFLGCRKFGEELKKEPADYFVLPCGTGTTAAGIIAGLAGQKNAVGISVLKGDFMRDAIAMQLETYGEKPYSNWTTEEKYHFGGYAKSTDELTNFIRDFQNEFGIPLEPVYTGKMMFALDQMIRSGKFERGSVVMAVHTGGIFESGSTE